MSKLSQEPNSRIRSLSQHPISNDVSCVICEKSRVISLNSGVEVLRRSADRCRCRGRDRCRRRRAPPRRGGVGGGAGFTKPPTSSSGTINQPSSGELHWPGWVVAWDLTVSTVEVALDAAMHGLPCGSRGAVVLRRLDRLSARSHVPRSLLAVLAVLYICNPSSLGCTLSRV